MTGWPGPMLRLWLGPLVVTLLLASSLVAASGAATRADRDRLSADMEAYRGRLVKLLETYASQINKDDASAWIAELSAGLDLARSGLRSAEGRRSLIRNSAGLGRLLADSTRLQVQLLALRGLVPEALRTVEPSSPGAGASEAEKVVFRLHALDLRVEAFLAGLLVKAVGESSSGAGRTTAGATVGGEISFSGGSRWDQAKDRLARLLRAYTEKATGSFMAQFSEAAAQALSVISNAIRAEFQNETDIVLDIELLEYRFTVDTLLVRFRWNRQSQVIRTGRAKLNAGIAKFWMRRTDGYRVYQVSGALPFGLEDAELQKLARSGDPSGTTFLDANGNPVALDADGTAPGGVIDPPAMVGTPPPFPPPPPPPFGAPFPLLLDPMPGGTGNVALIDVETGIFSTLESATPDLVVPGPSDDFVISIPLGVPPPFVTIRAVNTSSIANCGGGAGPLMDLAEVNVGGLVFEGTDDDISGPFFAAETTDGNRAFLEIVDPGLLIVALGGPGLVVTPTGSQTCP